MQKKPDDTKATMAIGQLGGGKRPAGTGTYSNVYRVRQGEKTFALKLFEKLAHDYFETHKVEAKFLSQPAVRACPWISKLVQTCRVFERVQNADSKKDATAQEVERGHGLILEWIDGDPLASIPYPLLKFRKDDPFGPMHMERMRQWTFQLVSALAAIHSTGNIHGDVSMTNIMLLKDNSLCLIDGNMVQPVGKIIQHELTCCETRPPEHLLLSAHSYAKYECTVAHDIWSLGCVLASLWRSDTAFFSIRGGNKHTWEDVVGQQFVREIDSTVCYNPNYILDWDDLCSNLLFKSTHPKTDALVQDTKDAKPDLAARETARVLKKVIVDGYARNFLRKRERLTMLLVVMETLGVPNEAVWPEYPLIRCVLREKDSEFFNLLQTLSKQLPVKEAFDSKKLQEVVKPSSHHQQQSQRPQGDVKVDSCIGKDIDALADLIALCLAYDPSKRPSAATLLQHPFLATVSMKPVESVSSTPADVIDTSFTSKVYVSLL